MCVLICLVKSSEKVKRIFSEFSCLVVLACNFFFQKTKHNLSSSVIAAVCSCVWCVWCVCWK